MASGDKYGFESGYVNGTGALINVELPFVPRAVKLFNTEGLATLEYSYPMPPDTGVKLLQGAPPVMSVITADGIIPVEKRELDVVADPARGFSIGADTDVNVADEDIYWMAWA